MCEAAAAITVAAAAAAVAVAAGAVAAAAAAVAAAAAAVAVATAAEPAAVQSAVLALELLAGPVRQPGELLHDLHVRRRLRGQRCRLDQDGGRLLGGRRRARPPRHDGGPNLLRWALLHLFVRLEDTQVQLAGEHRQLLGRHVHLLDQHGAAAAVSESAVTLLVRHQEVHLRGGDSTGADDPDQGG